MHYSICEHIIALQHVINSPIKSANLTLQQAQDDIILSLFLLNLIQLTSSL